jgi:Uma2 family endonuclease
MGNGTQNEKGYTAEEYLEGEKAAEYRSEYYFGEVFAMAGATQTHNLITGNVFALLRALARTTKYRAFSSDMQLEVNPGKFYAYPDVIYTGNPSDRDERLTLKRPVLLVEVLSDSTESFDLGRKLDEYLKIPSLLYYLIVQQKAHHVRGYERKDGEWKYSIVEGLAGQVHLPQLGVSLPMADIYEDVLLEPQPFRG